MNYDPAVRHGPPAKSLPSFHTLAAGLRSTAPQSQHSRSMEWPFCPLCTCSRRRLSLLPAGRGMTPPELTGERIEQQWPCDLREILIGRLRKRPGKAVNRVQEKKSRRTPTYSLTESPSETFTRPRLIPDIKKMVTYINYDYPFLQIFLSRE